MMVTKQYMKHVADLLNGKVVFWLKTCIFNDPQGGGSRFLHNIYKFLPGYTVSHLKRLYST